MALDTGDVAGLDQSMSGDRGDEAVREPAPTLQSGGDIGQALKAVRDYHGLTLDQLAEATRVRASYLAAIEQMQLQKLPSRPFTIGYIRAYAQALGLDAEAAVERFKSDEPVLDEPLRAPVGVLQDRDPRLTIIFVAVLVIVAAIVMWNVAQRGMTAAAPPPAKAPDKAAARALAAQTTGPVSLGAPLPAPVESTTPPPYETPGLDQADAQGVSHTAPAKLGVRADGEPAIDVSTLPPTFVPNGRIYGAPPTEASYVTLQAVKSTSLIIRGSDGTVYFARQLAAGQAYRAPLVGGLVADAVDPDHFQVFVAGQSKGLLPSAQVSLSSLSSPTK